MTRCVVITRETNDLYETLYTTRNGSNNNEEVEEEEAEGWDRKEERHLRLFLLPVPALPSDKRPCHMQTKGVLVMNCY